MNLGIWSDIILGVIGIAFIWFFAYVGFYLKDDLLSSRRDINNFLAITQDDDYKGEKGDR